MFNIDGVAFDPLVKSFPVYTLVFRVKIPRHQGFLLFPTVSVHATGYMTLQILSDSLDWASFFGIIERAQAAQTYLSQLVDAMVKMLNRRNGCLLIGLSMVILRMDGSIKSVNTMELMIDLPIIKPQL